MLTYMDRVTCIDIVVVKLSSISQLVAFECKGRNPNKLSLATCSDQSFQASYSFVWINIKRQDRPSEVLDPDVDRRRLRCTSEMHSK